jgi:uncharacterized protein (TIGR00645 family)
MRWPSGRDIEAAVHLSRWLIVPFMFGLLCCVIMIIIRFFADLFELAVQISGTSWHDLVVDVLNLVDLTLMANLILIVVFSAHANYIQKIDPVEHPDWPPGLTNVDFGALKQKLLGSITAIAAVDALAWYLDLEKYTDTSKLSWAIAFPIMFVVAMVLLAVAERLDSGRPRQGRQDD